MSWASRSRKGKIGSLDLLRWPVLAIGINPPQAVRRPARSRSCAKSRRGRERRIAAGFGFEVRPGRLVVAIGQEYQNLLLGGAIKQGFQTYRDRIADVGSVFPGPSRFGPRQLAPSRHGVVHHQERRSRSR